MLSRRQFVFKSLALLSLPEIILPVEAKRLPKKAKATLPTGLRSLARQDWPPAILPDQVKFIDKGYSCFTDEFGRLTIVDLRKAGEPRVIGELPGLGKRIMDLAISNHRAWVLAFKESVNGDPQFMLLCVNLSPSSEPTIASRLVLDTFSEPTCIAVQQDVVCVAGTSLSGEYIVSVFNAGSRHKGLAAAHMGTVTTAGPVSKLLLENKRLFALQAGRTSLLDCFDIDGGRIGNIHRQVKLPGEYRSLAYYQDCLVAAGKNRQGCDMQVIGLLPEPHTVSNSPLSDFSAVYDMSAQRDVFYVLGENKTQKMVAISTLNPQLQLTLNQTLALPASKEIPGVTARLAVKDNLANVVSGSAEVDILNFDKLGWHHFYRYSIPRLPASSLVTFGNLAVVSGANLSSYDISQPDKPVLKESIATDGTLKSLAAAGSYLLCLGKQNLTLRKMDNLAGIITSLKISGQQLAYEPDKQIAYVLSKETSKVVLTPVSTYTDKFIPGPTIDLPPDFKYISAQAGLMAVGGLSDLSLYTTDASPTLIGSRHFETQAIRDLLLTDQYLIATVVDHSSQGYLLILSRQTNDKQLNVLGSVDLPHDGAAVAVAGQQAVVVGRNPDGQDLVCLVDIKSPGLPKVTASLPVVEAASAVAITDHLAIIVGRGLEILATA